MLPSRHKFDQNPLTWETFVKYFTYSVRILLLWKSENQIKIGKLTFLGHFFKLFFGFLFSLAFLVSLSRFRCSSFCLFFCKYFFFRQKNFSINGLHTLRVENGTLSSHTGCVRRPLALFGRFFPLFWKQKRWNFA